MLERLILDSFQQHRHLDVRLEQVTTFVGPSQRGKSSILRAVRWVGLNLPFGARFATWGEDATAASLKVDGRWVVRKWSPKENCYELDGVPYFSLRAPSVPETIAAVLNVDPLLFQLQFDPPFWLFETAGEVSRRLNEVVNLGEIDDALGQAAAAVKRSKANVELCTERLAGAEAKAADLKWVAAADRALAELESLHDAVTAASDQINDLTNILGDVSDLDDNIAWLEEVIRSGDRLLDIASELTMSQALTFVLRDILTEVGTIDRGLDRLEGLDKAWRLLAAVRADGDRAAEERRDLEAITDELSQAGAEICRSDETIEAAEAELARLTKGRCPTCGQPANASQLLSATPTSASGAR